MPLTLTTLVAFAAIVAAACTSGGNPGASPTGDASATAARAGTTITMTPYHVTIDPTDFSPSVTNPWFPLKPGTTFIYRGVKDNRPLRDVFVVTNQTALIDGVECVVISDMGYLNGVLSEKTKDYYTQDNQGNVWYFGEDTAELNSKGQVTSTEGSWRAGAGGAQPGIFMDANPAVGLSHRQEYLPGQAEDQYQTVSMATSVSVPFGSFSSAMLTKEWTVLEPGVLDHKYYVKGVGEVAEISVKGPVEKACWFRSSTPDSAGAQLLFEACRC